MRLLLIPIIALAIFWAAGCGDTSEEPPSSDEPAPIEPNHEDERPLPRPWPSLPPNPSDPDPSENQNEEPDNQNEEPDNQDDPPQELDPSDIPIGESPDGDSELTLLGGGLPDQLQPLLQGDNLTWEQGIQGGFHIWGAFELQDSAIADLSTSDLGDLHQEYNIYNTDGELIATTNRLGFAEVDGNTINSGPFTVILRRSLNPNDKVDDNYLFELNVTVGTLSYENTLWIGFDCCHWL